MNADQARELLPLYAGDDLAPDERAAVAAALADDAELAAEAAELERLDALLSEALAPAVAEGGAAEDELPAWLADAVQHEPAASTGASGDEEPMTTDLRDPPDVQEAAGASATITRRCPYCHDGLASDEERVLCAECATPHHAACFSEHGGCALRGCESVRSIDASEAAARQVCGACQGLSPAEAPFCAWCGESLGAGTPRPITRLDRVRGASLSLRQYAAAAGLVLAASLGIGGYLGMQQESLIESLTQQGLQARRDREIRWVEDALRALSRLQRLNWSEDLDGDGVQNYNPDLDRLRQDARRLNRPEITRLVDVSSFPSSYRFKLHTADDHFVIEATPKAEQQLEFGYPLPGLVSDSQGNVDRWSEQDARMGSHFGLQQDCAVCHQPAHGAATQQELQAAPGVADNCQGCHGTRRWTPRKDWEHFLLPGAPATASIRGRVLGLRGHEVTLSVGRDDGVEPGDVFSIQREDEEVGRVKVERVSRDTCSGRLLEGRAVAGDVAATRGAGK